MKIIDRRAALELSSLNKSNETNLEQVLKQSLATTSSFGKRMKESHDSGFVTGKSIDTHPNKVSLEPINSSKKKKIVDVRTKAPLRSGVNKQFVFKSGQGL